MADFNWVPDRGVGQTFEAKVDTASFGDGYEQRAAKGLNNVVETVGVSFTLRTRAEIDAIDAFLRARRGVTNFTFSVAGAAERRYTCASWSPNYEHDGDCSLSAEFKRDFNA